jgi:HSP20 family protein
MIFKPMSNLIKWSPFFDGFEDADKMFPEFVPMVRRTDAAGFVPAIDMYEDKNNLIVETQLAGTDPEKVSIAIENDVLTIKGESEKKSEVEDKDYYRKEIRRGSFFRSIPLPAHVDGDKASAISEAGILKISIPKRAEQVVKNIKIEKK